MWDRKLWRGFICKVTFKEPITRQCDMQLYLFPEIRLTVNAQICTVTQMDQCEHISFISDDDYSSVRH